MKESFAEHLQEPLTTGRKRARPLPKIVSKDEDLVSAQSGSSLETLGKRRSSTFLSVLLYRLVRSVDLVNMFDHVVMTGR